jgi:hypothetical protein
MKKTACLLVWTLSVMVTRASVDSLPVNIRDVESVDAIVLAVYDVISGPAGQKRNWDRMRTLFTPDARMMPTGTKSSGEGVRRVLSVEEYISSSGAYLEQNGFFETEIGRRTERFGNIVHVFSTYESRKRKEDEQPFMRGINSFQIWNDGKRWWVISILWENESAANPIPEKYIGNRQ